MHNDRIYQMAIDGKAHQILRFVDGRHFSNMDMLRSLACEHDYDFGLVSKELLAFLDQRTELAEEFDNMTPFSAARTISRGVVKAMFQMEQICLDSLRDECALSPSLRMALLKLAPGDIQDKIDDLILECKKIHAIKLFREQHPSLGLKEAKDAIDTRAESLMQELAGVIRQYLISRGCPRSEVSVSNSTFVITPATTTRPFDKFSISLGEFHKNPTWAKGLIHSVTQSPFVVE